MKDKAPLVPIATQQHEMHETLIRLARDPYYTQIKHYDGELGAIYSPTETTFVCWSPNANQVELLLYDDHYGDVRQSIYMPYCQDDKVFRVTQPGDLHGQVYTYRVTFPSGIQEIATDPYARAVTVNGYRSVVVDLTQTDPEGWDRDKRMAPFEHTEKAIIYEAHVRDLTISQSSNIVHKGKFLGLAETGRVNESGSPAGLDYLKDLGITHVEFLPLFDYMTVDETQQPSLTYNWGYDPLNYNVPEGSYATNPYDPLCRIRELKTLIKTLHDHGIRVIMDVVYNHVYQVENHPFHQTAPGYYFRYNPNGTLTNGTGVGNDTASERAMVRKYIVDSIVYWAREYHIDGFRFDLMGIHDIETMNQVRAELDVIDPSIIILGEGWYMNTPLPEEYKANQNNAKKMSRIAHFNDALREGVKGNDFDVTTTGFVNGAWYHENMVVDNMMGQLNSGKYLGPLQLIQYVEAHDNQTLFDKLTVASRTHDLRVLSRQHMLATAIILLAQGIPFIHAGQEFMRTKDGIRDSYNQPDSINQLDWNRQDQFRESVEFVKGLIQIRQREHLLTLTNYSDIRELISVQRQDNKVIQLTYEDEHAQLILIMNVKSNSITMDVAPGEYIIKVRDFVAYPDDDTTVDIYGKVVVESTSLLLLKKLK